MQLLTGSAQASRPRHGMLLVALKRMEETKAMIIGDRLRVLREHKKLSQGDIEKRTGLLRCYISRVEYGHTLPAVETLEKFARALEVPWRTAATRRLCRFDL